jgi:hypothetical protein
MMPKDKKIKLSITLSKEVYDSLDDITSNKSGYIEKMLTEKLKK